jgi:transglutaminase-like putative cysteine protease
MNSALRFCWIVFLSFSAGIYAVAQKYPVSSIPEELKKDVNAVVREDRMVYKIISRNKAKLSTYFAVTIFNDKGQYYARRSVDYNKLSKISNFNASVYDAYGQQIKKLKNNEILDQSAFDGSSLFSDVRLKSFDLRQSSYPYTVVFEYEKDYNFLYHIDGSTVASSEKVAVESFYYQLIYPENLKPRYKTLNIDGEPKAEKTEDGLESLTWTLQNVMPIKKEPFAPSDAFYKAIIPAPSEFEFDGYPGTMASWSEFGKWIQTLNKGRNILPAETAERVKQLTVNAKTKEEKIRILYEHLQGKTRYVGIQLGIGGLQPFEAAVVDATGYGDCKALSNYMISMLETVGIKAHYALINAGEDFDKLDRSFPSHQFNHALVAVPNEKDTIWLECTSQTNPFGYQGTFTGDRQALLITDAGASIVNTTRYNAEQNIQSRTAEVYLDLTGDATAKVKTSYSGIQYENDHLHFIVNYQYEQQKKWVQSNTKIPSFDLNAFSMSNNKDRVPTATVNLDLGLRRYATVNGKRMFLTPNLMERSTFVPEKVQQRTTNVVRDFPYIDTDTIRYHLPEEIYPEFLPQPVKLSTRFGEYEATFKVDQGSLIYTRRMKMNKGEFPPESYNELIDFYKNISKADNTKVVFMTKT